MSHTPSLHIYLTISYIPYSCHTLAMKQAIYNSRCSRVSYETKTKIVIELLYRVDAAVELPNQWALEKGPKKGQIQERWSANKSSHWLSFWFDHLQIINQKNPESTKKWIELSNPKIRLNEEGFSERLRGSGFRPFTVLAIKKGRFTACALTMHRGK